MTESPKQKAIRISNEKQNEIIPNWNEKALNLLRSFAPTVRDFITEDFRMYAESKGLEKPKEPRSYGAVILTAKKIGYIVLTGKYRAMKSSISHGCPKSVWMFNKK